ncbi:MAG TPA: hypothetical protein VIM79_12800 [Niastella sp.]
MKPLFSFFLLAILFMNACKPANHESEKDKSDNGNDNSAAILKDTIRPDVARRMVRNFDGRVHQMGPHAGIKYSDTRCVWFSSSQLKSLLNRIDSEGGNGIRFYMATYDSTAKPGFNIPDRYRNLSTLIMVSTRDSITPNGDILRWDYYNRGGRLRGGILAAEPENRGEICPPPSNCAADGATLLEP